MGTESEESGTLYILNPDGTMTELSSFCLTDLTVTECPTSSEEDAVNPYLKLRDSEMSYSVDCQVNKSNIFLFAVLVCPNKRVAHLALHARRARTRKKNSRRALKIFGRSMQ